MKPSIFDWRAIVAGLAIAGTSASLGAAVNVRDRVAKVEAVVEMNKAVQSERDGRILADLEAIKRKLGVP